MKITAIKQQTKRPDRYSIFVDGTYAFSLSEGALLEQRIAGGQEIDTKQLQAYKQASADDKAYGNALRYVAMRPHSEYELRTYLQRKKVEEPVANTIVIKLRHLGLVDDAAFAASWVAGRRQLKSASDRKLRQELLQKRVPEHIIQTVLRDQVVDELTALRQLAQKKRRLPKYAADQSKLMQYLARQGFGYEDIKSVLAEME